MDEKGLVCINDGKGTIYNSSQNTESAIDLTEIAGISTWEVLNHSTIGSDHYPIVTDRDTTIWGSENTKMEAR